MSDFRSDTVTRPSAAMREVMSSAEVGDDVLDGDPTVEALQESVARWVGKERALFVPSGTMANQVALGAWTRAGDEIVVEAAAHIANWEGGAAGYLHGVQTRTLVGAGGALDPEAVRGAIQPASVHCPQTTLVCIEQTHMGSGGRVVPLEALQAVHRQAYSASIPVHMDGARLANAVAASGIAASEWAATADSVSICLSKGLGAPVGSVICGDADFIERGMVVRKRLGGWMRQAGMIAAAGKMALEENVERLTEDHDLARSLATKLNAFDILHCPPDEVETNLVMVGVNSPRFDADDLAQELAAHGVRVLPLGREILRFVTHMDVGPEDVEKLDAALLDILG